MLGSAIYRVLSADSNNTILTASHKELDLTIQKQVYEFFGDQKIQQVYLAAAKAGGIFANNNFPADFIYNNLMIQANVIHASFLNNVKKLLFIGSSCIYPKFANQPITETSLLSGYLEPTNEPYSIAKIAGIKICESYNRQYGEKYGIDYRSITPTNLYGPGDNYLSVESHVIPALIKKFHEAKINNSSKVEVWGSGKVKREFMYVDDCAKGAIFVNNLERRQLDALTSKMCSHINIGTGSDLSIRELSEIIKNLTGFNGKISYDESKPDGTPRKLLDSKLINDLGWRPEISLEEGLKKTYSDFLENYV